MIGNLRTSFFILIVLLLTSCTGGEPNFFDLINMTKSISILGNNNLNLYSREWTLEFDGECSELTEEIEIVSQSSGERITEFNSGNGFELHMDCHNNYFKIRIENFGEKLDDAFSRGIVSHSFDDLLSYDSASSNYVTNNLSLVVKAHFSDGSTLDSEIVVQGTPPPSHANQDFLQVEHGESHSCGLTHRNETFCWGDNNYLQLGILNNNLINYNLISFSSSQTTTVLASVEEDNKTAATFLEIPVKVGELGYIDIGSTTTVIKSISDQMKFSKIVVGGNTTCGINFANRVVCWGGVGSNTELSGYLSFSQTRESPVGRVGYIFPRMNDSEQNTFVHTSNGILSNVVDLKASSSAFCAKVVDGSNSKLYCWSNSINFVFADNGTSANQYVMSNIALPSDENEIGDYFVFDKMGCYTKASENNALYCWGMFNLINDMGDSASPDYYYNIQYISSAVQFNSNGDGFTQVKNVISLDNNLCAINELKEVYCWGEQADKVPVNVADSSATTRYPSEGRVKNGLGQIIDFKSIFVASYNVMCGLQVDGLIGCWGYTASTDFYEYVQNSNYKVKPLVNPYDNSTGEETNYNIEDIILGKLDYSNTELCLINSVDQNESCFTYSF